ncbi:hypothetical protein BS47DRAFT_1402868 [Hydnum rufescens UP504]|uniref:Uncharacterized protein n=1 Tax=Hydnum rufescens UP504 TaxID=1448309 RepID=A0A9P6DEE5_9AGAM|nr:hypothetical protein BS47DRAFT_1402868 [Hydnum rufescens UP504]
MGVGRQAKDAGLAGQNYRADPRNDFRVPVPRKIAVVRRKNLADLLSIFNALPGPGSTQLAFSIALWPPDKPLVGNIVARLPGALGMSAPGFAVQKCPKELPQIALAAPTGISAAGSPIPAMPAYQLSLTTVTDRITRLLLCLSSDRAAVHFNLVVQHLANPAKWYQQPLDGYKMADLCRIHHSIV